MFWLDDYFFWAVAFFLLSECRTELAPVGSFFFRAFLTGVLRGSVELPPCEFLMSTTFLFVTESGYNDRHIVWEARSGALMFSLVTFGGYDTSSGL
jgi:hypothetical protein